MSTTAYDLSRFSSENVVERRRIEVIDNPKRAAKSTRYRGTLIMLSVFLVVLMVLTVYNNMVLTDTKNLANAAVSNLNSLESEYTYLSYKLDSMVSLKNAEDYVVKELGLVKVNPSQVEYISLQNSDVIEKNEISEQKITDIFTRLWSAVIAIF
ncbi:MAG: hypothetical protein GX222_08060 [Ruminococcaceae bacterium]|nr:hypothetical protein [Oscillospiraceae bacterium]